MDSDIKRARQVLAPLPHTPEKSEALRLLAEIEKSEVENKVIIEELERIIEKCRLTENEKRLYRWLSLFSIGLSCIASYDGIAAIVTKEFCYYSRNTWSCSAGHIAQIKGVLILIIGVLLFLLALPEGKWRTISLYSMGFLFFSVFLGGSFLV